MGGGEGSMYIGGHIYEIPPASPRQDNKWSLYDYTALGENHNARIIICPSSSFVQTIYPTVHSIRDGITVSQANIMPVQVSHLVNKIKSSLYSLFLLVPASSSVCIFSFS